MHASAAAPAAPATVTAAATAAATTDTAGAATTAAVVADATAADAAAAAAALQYLQGAGIRTRDSAIAERFHHLRVPKPWCTQGSPKLFQGYPKLHNCNLSHGEP